ncbi:MAG TPA: lysophospholipid acyltransferase family protein [Vicinamibacteria bacterium]
MIRTALVLLFLGPYSILASAFGYPVARLVGSPSLLYTLGRFGVRTALGLAGIRVCFEGTERLAGARNVVVMPNHTSHLDAAILFGLIDLQPKAVVKKELYSFPFLHYCLRYAGFIEIDRKDPMQSKRAIDRAVKALAAGSTFIIFPEGTRSRTGELGPFKKGGFVVAIEAGSRILPLAVSGATELLPPGRFLIKPGTVRIRVLDAVDASKYSYADRERLRDEARGRIAAALSPPVEA